MYTTEKEIPTTRVLAIAIVLRHFWKYQKDSEDGNFRIYIKTMLYDEEDQKSFINQLMNILCMYICIFPITLTNDLMIITTDSNNNNTTGHEKKE